LVRCAFELLAITIKIHTVEELLALGLEGSQYLRNVLPAKFRTVFGFKFLSGSVSAEGYVPPLIHQAADVFARASVHHVRLKQVK
jgi:hypothetical protein